MKSSRKRLVVSIPLLLLGCGYCLTFSQLEVHPLLHVQLFGLPIQLGLAAYFLWWRQTTESTHSKITPSSSTHGRLDKKA